MAESLRCKVEEHLTCSVCLKQFKDPKVLPCLHSYCHDCIVKLAQNAKSNKFNCPNCRLEVKVRKHFIHMFKKKFCFCSLVLRPKKTGRDTKGKQSGIYKSGRPRKHFLLSIDIPILSDVFV